MIEHKILDAVRRYNMLKKGDRVLIGFSGGIDSTALARALISLRGRLGIKLFAAHLDHMIRGDSAREDSRYVEAFCTKYRIPCIIEKIDVPENARKNRMGLEEAARTVRYDFLERIAKRVGADRIALAHNADDNVETFLMRLIRGAGMKGLSGIPAVRGKVIRPMIGIFRCEIERYLDQHKIKPRLDETNSDTKYFRNRVRHELIPQLEKYNSNIKSSILNTIEMINGLYGIVESDAENALRNMSKLERGTLSLKASAVAGMDEPIRSELIRKAIRAVKNDLKDVSFVHIDSIINNLGKKRAEIHLPGIFVRINKGSLLISRKAEPKRLQEHFAYSLKVPGSIRAKEGFTIRAEILKSISPAKLRAGNPYQAYLDYDKIGKRLNIRNRRPGDRFTPLGLKGSKKLQDIFVDSKVDMDERDRIPLVSDGKNIIWVVGYRMSELAKVTSGTKRIVKLNAKINT